MNLFCKEVFVTLFSVNYLPQGMSLYQSLRNNCANFLLYVVAMDEKVERALSGRFPSLIVISLGEIETERHLRIKGERSFGEWCWTMTPTAIKAAMDRSPNANRVSYIDADMWFLRSPELILSTFTSSSETVLVTEHNYSPWYNQESLSGRFCVQFITIYRDDSACNALHWWEERCIEWCFARRECGKFGDQKYLDQWPHILGRKLLIVDRWDAFTAPWNVARIMARAGRPVFHHFHGFKILNCGFLLWKGYQLMAASALYFSYARSVAAWMRYFSKNGVVFDFPEDPFSAGRIGRMKRAIARMLGFLKYG